MASIELVRLIIAYAVACGWDIEHIDVKGAFLNATLPPEDRFVIRLPFIAGSRLFNGQLVRLLKSLHGILQAPKLW